MNSRLQRAKVELTARNTQTALSLVNEVIEGGEDDWPALMVRARVLERLGRFGEAAADLGRVRTLNPSNDMAAAVEARLAEQSDAFARAETLLTEERPEDALTLLQAMPPASASTRQLLIARALFALRRLLAAEANVDRFLAEQPGHTTGADLRAQITAARDSRRLSDLPPENRPATAARAALGADVAALDAAVASGDDIAALVDPIRERRDDIAAGRWQDDAALAKAAHFAFARDVPRAIRNYNAHLIEKSAEFGYITWPRRIQDYIVGRSVLDVGCGFGAFGNGFLVAGASSYTGVDPQMPLDSRLVKNKRIRKRADLGMTPREVMAVCPDIHLVDGVFEDFQAGTKFDVVVLHNVTEHLLRLEQVMLGIRELMTPTSHLIFHHHNFYCWNGHHQAPNMPAQYDEENKSHRLYVDWRHILIARDLPKGHYFNTGLNQIRLDDLKSLIEREFAVETWAEIDSSKDTERRLTPSRLGRLQEHDPTLTRRDLLVKTVLCVAKLNS